MALEEWSKYIYQVMDQVVEANPALQNAPDQEMIMQFVMQDEMARQMITAIQLAQQHIEEHSQLQQNEGLEGGEQQPSRRRQAVPFPTGNIGRTESIVSNQMQGT